MKFFLTNGLEHKMEKWLPNNWTWIGWNNSASKNNVVFPKVHRHVPFIQRLFRGRSWPQKWGPIIRNGGRVYHGKKVGQAGVHCGPEKDCKIKSNKNCKKIINQKIFFHFWKIIPIFIKFTRNEELQMGIKWVNVLGAKIQSSMRTKDPS